MDSCKFCNGSGFINVGFKKQEQLGHRALYPYAEPCYCKVNVIMNNKFKILSAVNDADPIDSETINKKFNSGNYIFFGEESKFLYIVKCLFLKGFMYKNYLILEGGNIVEQFNVPRDTDGEWLTTSYLNQYDILVILFTTSARYNSLKDCVLEVIKNRMRLNKYTWIYSRSLDDLKNSREYSVELEPYLEKYAKIDLSKINRLKGYKDVISFSEKQRKANDTLANI